MFNKIQNKIKGDIHLKDLIKGSAITFFLKMLGMLIGYILIYLISKKNGAAGVGFYNLFNQALMVLAMVIGLGLNVSVLRFVGQFNNETNQSKIHLLYHYIIRLVVPLGIIVGVFLIFSANYITKLLGKNEEYATGIRLTGFILPFFAMNQISVEFIRGLKKLQISELIRSIIRPFFMVVVILILLEKPITNIDILYLFVIGSIMNSIISGGTIRLRLKKISQNNTTEFTQGELLKISSPMMLTSIASVLMVGLPIFFLNYFATENEVGIFSVAFRISQLVSLVLVIVNTIAAPKFAELYWSDKKEELQNFIFHSAKIMFWVAFLLSLTIIIKSEWILASFGDEFVKGKWVLVILVIGQFINAATGSVGVILNMTGNQKVLRNIIIITCLLSLFGFYFIIPVYGIYGAAWVSMLGVILLNIYSVVFVYKKMRFITFFIPRKIKLWT